MRKLTASVMLVMAACATAQTNAPIDNFTLVTNLWWNGYKTNVLQIAEQRLAANSNDLAGLILKMEYDFEFMDRQAISNDILAVIAEAGALSSGKIADNFQVILFDAEYFLDFLSTYHPTDTEYENDRDKAFIPYKRMTHELYLKWLHDDGLF